MASAGFTFVEVIVVVAVLALIGGSLAPLMVHDLRQRKNLETRLEMEAILRGVLGDPDQGFPGFMSDVGAFPFMDATCSQLATPACGGGVTPIPAGLSSASVVYGWNGPYVTSDFHDVHLDAWSRPYLIPPNVVPAPPAGTWQLQSAGADGVIGNVDDIYVPPVPVQLRPTASSLSLDIQLVFEATSYKLTGNQVECIRFSWADGNGNIQTMTYGDVGFPPAAGLWRSPYYVIPNGVPRLHRGAHEILVQVRDPVARCGASAVCFGAPTDPQRPTCTGRSVLTITGEEQVHRLAVRGFRTKPLRYAGGTNWFSPRPCTNRTQSVATGIPAGSTIRMAYASLGGFKEEDTNETTWWVKNPTCTAGCTAVTCNALDCSNFQGTSIWLNFRVRKNGGWFSGKCRGFLIPINWFVAYEEP